LWKEQQHSQKQEFDGAVQLKVYPLDAHLRRKGVSHRHQEPRTLSIFTRVARGFVRFFRALPQDLNVGIPEGCVKILHAASDTARGKVVGLPALVHDLQKIEYEKALAVDLQKTKDKKARSFSNLPL
jgi:hypothetical protein